MKNISTMVLYGHGRNRNDKSARSVDALAAAVIASYLFGRTANSTTEPLGKILLPVVQGVPCKHTLRPTNSIDKSRSKTMLFLRQLFDKVDDDYSRLAVCGKIGDESAPSSGQSVICWPWGEETQVCCSYHLRTSAVA